MQSISTAPISVDIKGILTVLGINGSTKQHKRYRATAARSSDSEPIQLWHRTLTLYGGEMITGRSFEAYVGLAKDHEQSRRLAFTYPRLGELRHWPFF